MEKIIELIHHTDKSKHEPQIDSARARNASVRRSRLNMGEAWMSDMCRAVGAADDADTQTPSELC